VLVEAWMDANKLSVSIHPGLN